MQTTIFLGHIECFFLFIAADIIVSMNYNIHCYPYYSLIKESDCYQCSPASFIPAQFSCATFHRSSEIYQRSNSQQVCHFSSYSTVKYHFSAALSVRRRDCCEQCKHVHKSYTMWKLYSRRLLLVYTAGIITTHCYCL